MASLGSHIRLSCHIFAACRFFAYHFMEPGERQNFIRFDLGSLAMAGPHVCCVDDPGTTVFGGVTFQKTVPLSYWDVGVAQLKVEDGGNRGVQSISMYFSLFSEIRRSILPVGPSMGSWPLQRRLCSVSAASDFFAPVTVDLLHAIKFHWWVPPFSSIFWVCQFEIRILHFEERCPATLQRHNFFTDSRGSV